ncbi:ABC transporter permease [Pararhodonellum marinum]|uniref:ABC transporter permease n=1 Tax=Pararhodonellum marinum TaxID=2755358 RepID=UPI00188FDDF9|nr:ABC transporter permease [Pararhodonellum marinum]
MWKNHLKIAWRNILRSKGFAFINIGGLGIGIAASILIMVWVQFELSVDRFYEHSDRIYAVWRNAENQGITYSWDYTPAPYGPTLKEDYPEVEETTRITQWDPQILTVGSNSFYERSSFVDPGFFKIFSFEVIEGDPIVALEDPNSIILTETVAQKLFPDGDAMGKTVTVEKTLDFMVKAIIKDLPENTDFEFTFFLPFKKLEAMGWADPYWGNNSYRTFAMLQKGTDLNAFNEKISGFTERHLEDSNVSDFLFPMSDLHLYSKFENGKSVGGKIELIRLFGIVAIIVLLIACINFINLSTAQSENRAKEVGVRKVTGAGRGILISQFLVESIMITLFAFGIALLIVSLSLPSFQDLIGKNLQNPFEQPYFWVLGLGYILVVGLLAGSYPAFLLSSFSPSIVFKSKLYTKKYWINPRQALVVLQFAIVAILISSVWIIRDQMSFVQNRDLGLDKENLIFHPVTEPMRKSKLALREELLAMQEVASVTYTFSPLTDIYSNTGGMLWQGKNEEDRQNIARMGSDANLVETAGLELLAGRDIDVYKFPSDSNAVVLNEKALEIMGFEEPLGQVIQDGDLSFTVVGVVKDFIMESPFGVVQPIVVFGPKRNLDFIHIRIREGSDFKSSINNLDAVFSKFNPDAPFEYSFVDQVHAGKFENQERTSYLMGLFTALAIIISCLGLFGLAAFIAEQRRKEISVRKVLGASVPGLVRLISSEFTKLVLISVVLGIPVAWYFMDSWLQTFDYRTSIDWKIFLWTSVLALLIAFLTVSSQAIKAALVNPAKILQDE